MKKTFSVALIAFLSMVSAQSYADSPGAAPDIVYFNGKIVTLDAAESVASAVAVKDGKFVAVGASDAIRKLAGPSTTLVDLNQKLVVPGFIDAHTHPVETITMTRKWVDARFPRTASVKQALARTQDRLSQTPKGEWVFVACSSASQNKFEEKRLPTKAELDALAPDNPVALANGTHMFVVNSAALRALGVTKDNVVLAGGGRALLGEDGEPSGIFADGGAALPASPTSDELKEYYTKDIPAFWNAYGFTSAVAITSAQMIPALQAVAQTPVRPNLRYTVSVWTATDGAGMPDDLDRFRMPRGADAAFYRFAGIKLWMDGENDARTGLMYEPYEGHVATDPPGGTGVAVSSPAQLARFVEIANKNGVMSMMHCSGDKAIDLCLDAYEGGVAKRIEKTIVRIEHFGMFQLTRTQLERAAALRPQRFSVAIQPAWLLTLAQADIDNMGEERARMGFRFRALVDAGIEPAASTDMTGIYMDNINPFLGIYAAVTRNSSAGIFEPGQAVSVTEALKMWTIWAAKAMGEEAFKGSIEPGKYADMVVLSDDILTMPVQGLKDVKVLKTILDGRIVYDAK